MSILISDTLKLPNGEPMTKAKLTFTAINSVEVVKGSCITIVTSETGGIEVTLLKNKYSIDLQPSGKSIVSTHFVEVTDSTPSTLTLIELITNHAISGDAV